VHHREPGCAVREAVASGALDAQRHARYLALLEEVRLAWKGRFG
jgi:putative ribosome biogenesis GTPase RsgA